MRDILANQSPPRHFNINSPWYILDHTKKKAALRKQRFVRCPPSQRKYFLKKKLSPDMRDPGSLKSRGPLPRRGAPQHTQSFYRAGKHRALAEEGALLRPQPRPKRAFLARPPSKEIPKTTGQKSSPNPRKKKMQHIRMYTSNTSNCQAVHWTRGGPHAEILILQTSNTPTLGIKNTIAATFVAEVYALGWYASSPRPD